jgi:hypothetical protein
VSRTMLSFKTDTSSSDCGAAAVDRQAAEEFRPTERDDENCRHNEESIFFVGFFIRYIAD